MWDIEIRRCGNEYWVYQHSPESRSGIHFAEVVARFKHANPGRSAKHFVKFLVKNFTVAEYFAAKTKNPAPMHVLAMKGFVSYNAMKAGK